MKAGNFLTSDGNRVNVGNFDSNGFNVNRNWSENRNSNLRVVLVWNSFLYSSKVLSFKGEYFV